MTLSMLVCAIFAYVCTSRWGNIQCLCVYIQYTIQYNICGLRGKDCTVTQFQTELTLIKQPHGTIKSLDIKTGKALHQCYHFKATVLKSAPDIP